jgi:SnoaL-like polyketide cyclase
LRRFSSERSSEFIDSAWYRSRDGESANENLLAHFSRWCLSGNGAAAGYKLALVHEHDRGERNKALVRRIHAAVWSEANVEKATKAARELYAQNFVLHDWRGDDISGMDGLIKGVAEEHVTFSGLTELPETIMAEGDLVADRFITTGRQARDLEPVPHHSPGVPNRGKFLRMPEMEMFKVVNGKLAEQWLFPDIWGGTAQLGLYDPDHWTESICGAQLANGRR